MTLPLPTLAAAFAAFCVWLTVRIVNRRERWAKWTLAGVVGVPMLYVLSFGPACWGVARLPYGHARRDLFKIVYWPIGWIAEKGPPLIEFSMFYYAELGMPVGGDVSLPCLPGGTDDAPDIDDRPVYLLRTRVRH